MTEERAVSVGGYRASWTIFANGFRAKWSSPTKYALISRGPPLAIAFAITHSSSGVSAGPARCQRSSACSDGGWANNPDCDASSRETCCLACRLPSPARSSAAQSKTAKWRACSSRRLGAGRLAATVALRSSHDRNKGCGRPLSIASRRSSASKPPSLHHVATSTCCLAAASNSHRNLRASSARAFSISFLATLFLFGRTTTDLFMLLVWVCPRGRGYTDEVRRTPPLGPRPLGQTLGAALDSHRIISDVVGRIKKGGGAICAKNLSTFIDRRWRHAADARRCAQGPPWPQGSSLPFDINFARRRPHLAPDHFRDPLYDAQMWALRFVRRCGRRVKPMSRRIARISARMALRTRTVSRSRTSMFIGRQRRP